MKVHKVNVEIISTKFTVRSLEHMAPQSRKWTKVPCPPADFYLKPV